MLILLDIRRGRDRARGRRARRWSGPAGALPPARTRRWSALAFTRWIDRRRRVGLRHFLQDPFEYDFRKLNAKLDNDRGSAGVQPNIDDAVRPLAVADHRPRPTRSTRSSRSRRRSASRTRELPGRPTSSARSSRSTICCRGRPRCSSASWRCIAQIRKLTHDPALEVLDDKERGRLAKIDPPPMLHELAPMDLPPHRAPAVHRGRRHGRARWCWSTRRDRRCRCGTAAICCASPRSCRPQPRQRQGDRDVGRRRWCSGR